MFDVEIRINQKLNHDNIVNLHEIYTIPKLTLRAALDLIGSPQVPT